MALSILAMQIIMNQKTRLQQCEDTYLVDIGVANIVKGHIMDGFTKDILTIQGVQKKV